MQRNVRDYVPSYVLVLVRGKHSTATGRNARVGKTATNGERYKTFQRPKPRGALINILSQTKPKSADRDNEAACVYYCVGIESNRIRNSYCLINECVH